MRYLRVYSDEEGHSHFSEHDWDMHEEDFSPPSPAGYLTVGSTRCLVSAIIKF